MERASQYEVRRFSSIEILCDEICILLMTTLNSSIRTQFPGSLSLQFSYCFLEGPNTRHPLSLRRWQSVQTMVQIPIFVSPHFLHPFVSFLAFLSSPLQQIYKNSIKFLIQLGHSPGLQSYEKHAHRFSSLNHEDNFIHTARRPILSYERCFSKILSCQPMSSFRNVHSDI